MLVTVLFCSLYDVTANRGWDRAAAGLSYALPVRAVVVELCGGNLSSEQMMTWLGQEVLPGLR